MQEINHWREALNSEQRALLNELWEYFRKKHEWPTWWEFHNPHRKMAVRNAFKPLFDKVVLDLNDHMAGGRYQLTILGILLTEKGKDYERLLVRYLESLRRWYQAGKGRSIESSYLQSDLHLSDEETILLGQLVTQGRLCNGSGHSSNWSSPQWQAGVLNAVEEFPPEGELDRELEVLVLGKNQNASTHFCTEDDSSANLQKTHLKKDEMSSLKSKETVFVVHGRNMQLRDSMFHFLRAIGLRPLEWSQAIKATGVASPYIGQVLDAAFNTAQAIVILLSPDDEASLKPEFQADHDPDFEKKPTGQARPNVLFEAGMAMGRCPDRTILVQIGDIRPFSDIAGRHLVHLNDSSERRQEVAERLRSAGCAVDTTGTDWHRAGSFQLKDSNKENGSRRKRSS